MTNEQFPTVEDKPRPDDPYVVQSQLSARIDDVADQVESLDDQVAGLSTAIGGKQDVLTAGDNITIVDNVISASTGGGTTDIQMAVVTATEVDTNGTMWCTLLGATAEGTNAGSTTPTPEFTLDAIVLKHDVGDIQIPDVGTGHVSAVAVTQAYCTALPGAPAVFSGLASMPVQVRVLMSLTAPAAEGTTLTDPIRVTIPGEYTICDVVNMNSSLQHDAYLLVRIPNIEWRYDPGMQVLCAEVNYAGLGDLFVHPDDVTRLDTGGSGPVAGFKFTPAGGGDALPGETPYTALVTFDEP